MAAAAAARTWGSPSWSVKSEEKTGSASLESGVIAANACKAAMRASSAGSDKSEIIRGAVSWGWPKAAKALMALAKRREAIASTRSSSTCFALAPIPVSAAAAASAPAGSS